MTSFRLRDHRHRPQEVLTIRVASGPDDEIAVRALDDAAFPAGQDDVVRADPGELEEGVARGDIHVLQRGDAIAAYAHLDSSDPGHVYIAGFAVHPDVQSAGLGSYMIGRLMHDRRDELNRIPVTAVSSPHNHAMASLLLHHGFAVRWALRDFFGPGVDRYGFQLRRTPHRPPENGFPGRTEVVSADRPDTLFSLVAGEGMVARELIRTDSGPTFVLSAPYPDEFLPCAPPGSGKDAAQMGTPGT
ncbi:GNAT family N-acetyltransferase [Kineosporia succinea]|uniref:GNAT superfamily N-acetyltransferase n=1 Tax=Kineosporia succinea TaxID=84632 RepID=A0ABT9PDL6_9ACTN|nr:GNAT family N-acetyltransferase [Kineosporia succinea]MDP9830787.1 GNAT superfamily N-acetyltransferase [Kineosporia succinea]